MMCITIPSSARADRKLAPGHRVWRWLIDSPLRLFTTGGLLVLTLLGLLYGSTGPFEAAWVWFNLLFGVAAFFLFGLLLQAYPIWLRTTAVRYSRYGLVFFLLLGAQAVLYLSSWLGTGPGYVFLMILLVGWHLAISSLQGVTLLAAERRLSRVRGILPLLKLGVLCLVVAAVAMLTGEWTPAVYSLTAAMLLSFAPVLILSLMAHFSLHESEGHIH